MTTANTAPTYTLASNDLTPTKKKGSKNHKRGTNYQDPDPTDGSGSLTYSAASSVQSGGSAAGESTDSSFADIMRVLDVQDSAELAAFMKKEGVTTREELREKRGIPSSATASVASSLAYSTDAESHLEGSQLLQTIAGQPSDSYAFDGGGSYARNQESPIKGENDNILFAPAEPADPMTRKKDKKRRDKNSNNNAMTTPKAKNSHKSYEARTPPSSVSSSTRSSPKPATPPPLPPKGLTEEEEDIWYAKWWMSCFPDSFKNLMPKR